MRTAFILALFFLTACQNGNADKKMLDAKKTNAAKQHFKIMLLPLGKISSQDINATYRELRKIFSETQLLPVSSMPKSAYYSPRGRYRADTLIHWMHTLAKPREVYLGITSFDISSKKGNNPDFGIMGLGYRPGNACIASNFRLKDKSNFFKVVIHELGHTAGLPHCPEKTCFMRDAEGKDCTGDEKDFCVKCRKQLLLKGWKI